MALSVSDVDAIINAAPNTEINLPAYVGAKGDLDYLKSYVLSAVVDRYGVDPSVFDTATLLSTTILRDFVHRAIYMHPDLENYDTTAPDPFSYQSDVGGLFREGGWYQCGEISWQLQNIYQSLGYQSAVVWAFNGEDGDGTPYSYNDGHVRVDVYLNDYGKYVTQDVTYNWLFTNGDTGAPLSYHEAQALNFVDTSKLVFDDTGINTYYGYALNAPGVLPYFNDFYRSNYMNVTYAWMEDGVYSQQQRALTSDWYGSHDTLFKGAYASSADAAQAVLAFAAQDKSLLGITDALRPDHQVSGFRLLSMDGQSVTGDYVTLQLSDMSYVSVNISTGAILNGSYDQVVDDLTGGGQNLNPGVDTSNFFNPTVFVQYDGNLIAQWDIDRSNPVVAPLFAEEKTRWPVVYSSDGGWIQSFTDAYDQPFDHMTEYYNASGALYYKETWYDNGDYSQTPYDWQNQNSWSRFEYKYEHTGQHIFTTYYNDNGTIKVANFDIMNQPWDHTDIYYDAAGRLTNEFTAYDDGGYVLYKFDYLGENPVWSDWQYRYNSNGILTNELVNYDNGGWLIINYDYTNSYSWSNWQYRYDASGEIQAERYRNDDKTWVDVFHDANNTASWDVMYNRYTADGKLAATLVRNDDHSYSQTTYDPLNSQPWDYAKWDYNSIGQLVYNEYHLDDGGKQVILYDKANIYDWSDWQTTTNAAGQITREYVHYDDKHTTLTVYDPTNTQPYDHYIDTRDANGILLSHVVVPDHGMFVV